MHSLINNFFGANKVADLIFVGYYVRYRLLCYYFNYRQRKLNLIFTAAKTLSKQISK